MKVGDAYSGYNNANSGVPYGSSTRPLLVILYSNHLPDHVSHLNTVVHLFADDTNIYSPLSDVAENKTLQEQ